MFLVLLFLTLCLHAVDCPGWQPRTGAITPAGGDCTTPSPGFQPDAPGASGGGNSGGTSPAPPPPLGEAPGTGPPNRLEGVYPPTAHEGAPARGDGPGSSLGDGCNPGNGEGPHTAAGGWRYNRGHSRRGAAAPPPTGCDRRGSRWTPPPPLGEQGPGGQPGGEHCVSGDRQRREARQLPTLRGPCPDLLTSELSAAVKRTEAPCPQGAAQPPQLTRASGLTGAGGAAASQIAPVPCWTRPARMVVGTAAVPAPAIPPLGVAPMSGPPTWLEGVYTPTSHEGAPGRGDGTGSPPGAGASPGSGAGPHATAGGWRYNRGRSRRGTAAPPSAGRRRDGDRGPPPPTAPPPATRGNKNQETRRATRAAYPGGKGGGGRVPPSPPPEPPAPSGRASPPVDLQLACFAHGACTTRSRTGTRPQARARTRGPGPPCPPHGTRAAAPRPLPSSLVVRPSRPGVPAPPLAMGLCPHGLRPAPLVGLLPRVLQLQDLPAGA